LRRYVAAPQELAREASLFIAVPEFIRSCPIELGFPAERSLAHYIGVDPAAFRAFPAAERSQVVLFVGGLVEVERGARCWCARCGWWPAASPAPSGGDRRHPLRGKPEAMAAATGIRHRFQRGEGEAGGVGSRTTKRRAPRGHPPP
jgi:hypothetical protein